MIETVSTADQALLSAVRETLAGADQARCAPFSLPGVERVPGTVALRLVRGSLRR